MAEQNNAASYSQPGRMRLRLALLQRPCDDSILSSSDDHKACLTDPASQARSTFEFDHILGPSATQEAAFDAVGKPLVAQVLCGYDGVCMAYGTVGDARSHALVGGDGDSRGLMPRTFESIFSTAESRRAIGALKHINCRFSMLSTNGKTVKDLGGAAASSMKVVANESIVDNSIGATVAKDVTYIQVRFKSKETVCGVALAILVLPPEQRPRACTPMQ